MLLKQNKIAREEQQWNENRYIRGKRDEQQRYNRGPTPNSEYIIPIFVGLLMHLEQALFVQT